MDLRISRLRGYCVDVFEGVDGKTLTSFKSGGPVKWVIMPSDTDGLMETLQTLYLMGEQYYIVGNGTNILISDKGYNGAIVCLKRIKNLKVDDNFIYSASGVNISTISLIARDNALTGMEFAIGIPATLGGAIAMNAGAYGFQMSDKVEYIDVLNGSCVERWQNRDSNFGYRTSAFLENEIVVIGAMLNLDYGDIYEIRASITAFTENRKATQPNEASAGSVFKRVFDESAGFYIDQLGLKGKRIGGAEISKKHANFIINTGNATTDDFIELSNYIAEEVSTNYGFELEKEVKLIGD